jgi:uncharacterized protein (TIGR02757 family)
VARTDRRARRQEDPVSVVHALRDPLDQELAGLLASCLAFGKATVAVRKAQEAIDRLGLPLHAACDAPVAALERRLGDWKHRLYGAGDIARLLHGARRRQREAGSLGAALAACLDGRDFREGLGAFVRSLRAAGWGDATQGRAASHLLPDPLTSPSACKRLLLYLRWMVRPADGIDLGLWSARVSPARLLIPVDVHIHRLARNLGLTTRPTASWAAAEEITAHLARLRPEDPVFYDFALCHMGMVQRCPSEQDVVRCEGCGVRPVCVHWGPAERPRGGGRRRGE